VIANNTLGGKPTFAAVCIEVYNADFAAIGFKRANDRCQTNEPDVSVTISRFEDAPARRLSVQPNALWDRLHHECASGNLRSHRM
jgi:hypothetical protein